MSTETTNAWPALVRSTESGDFFRAPLAATLQGLGALGAAPVLLLLMKAMGDEAEPAPALFMAVACAGAAFFAGQVLFGRARRILEAQPVRFSVVPAIRECVRALAEAGFVWSMVLSTAGLLAVLWTAGDDLEQKLPGAFGAAIVIGVGGWLSLLFAHLFTELASALVEIANNTAGGWAARAAAPQSVVADPVAVSGATQSGVVDPASTPYDEAGLSFGREPKRDAAGAKLGLAAVGVVVLGLGIFLVTRGEPAPVSAPANRLGDDAQAMEDLDRALAGASGAQQANSANLGQARSGGQGGRGDATRGVSTAAAGSVESRSAVVVKVKKPKIEYGNADTDVESGDGGAIPSVVRKRAGTFQRCVEAGLKQDDSMSGRVSIGWSIVAGNVSNVHKVENTTGNDALLNCFSYGVRGLRFDETLTAEVAAYTWSVSGE